MCKKTFLISLVSVFLLWAVLGITSVVCSSSVLVTVTTSKQFYDPKENINLHGTLMKDSSPIDGLVALEIRNPDSRLIVIRTLQTGTNPPDENITIVDVYPCDSEGEPKYNLYRGLYTSFNVTAQNKGTLPKNVTITVNSYDANVVPFSISVCKITLEPGASVSYMRRVLVPYWVTLGTGKVYASALTGLPISGGAAYCPEKSATYEIVEPGGGAATLEMQKPNNNPLGVKSLTDPIGSYSLTFKVISGGENSEDRQRKIGTYMVYAGSSYQGLYDNDNTTFSIKVWGDINGDGHVDVTDFTILGMNWYLTVPPAYPPADINEDGIVDVTDFTILGMNWYVV